MDWGDRYIGVTKNAFPQSRRPVLLLGGILIRVKAVKEFAVAGWWEIPCIIKRKQSRVKMFKQINLWSD